MKDEEKKKGQITDELARTSEQIVESGEMKTQQRWAEEILRTIVEGTASVTGGDFFRSLVRNLASALRVRYAFVAEFTDVNTRVRTLAFWTGEGFLDNFEYDLVDTPCEQVLRGEIRHYREGVQALFPKDKALVKLGVEGYLAIPLIDPSGNVLGHLAAIDDKSMPAEARDMSIFKIFAARAGAELDRKRAGAALQESEQRYRDLYEEAPHVYLSVGIDGRIQRVNRRAVELFGYSRDKLIGQVVFDLAADTPTGKPKSQKVFQRFLVGKETHGEEVEFRRADGSQLWIDLSVRPIRDVKGRVEASRGILVDITDRKRAEDALKQHSQNLERVVEERTTKLRRAEERQRILLEINNAIIANLDRESLFQAVTLALRKVLHFDRASITLYDAVRDVFKVYVLASPSPSSSVLPVGAEIPRQGSRLGWVIEHKRSVRIRDFREEPGVAPEDRLAEEGFRSAIIVSLIAKGRAIGTLNLGSLVPDRYSEDDAEFLEEVAKQVALAVENMKAYEEIAQLKARLEQENLYLQEEIKTQHNFGEVIGQGSAIKRVLKAVETVAPTDANVLILGETGTGKELVARALHNLNTRKDKALVKVNCAALPSGLIESELFGHEKGAFTGALSRRIGRFELASGGTIFLDEIGDLPLELQAKLLRVLQDGEFERVGGTGSIKVNVRVIAATNRDLERSVQEKQFRQDLFYRLNVFPIRLPPLRERKEDIPLLVRYFAMKYGKKLGRKIETIPKKIMDSLTTYTWPGNVRELENVIERSVILSTGS
ncbi:MAG: sigma 54-interacting transcriptional regulator, partial [Candidatus Binatia bacterium]